MASFQKIDATFKSCHCRLFSFLLPADDQQLISALLSCANLDRNTFPNRHPAIAAVGKFAPAIRAEASLIPGLVDGRFHVFSSVRPAALPDCNYLALISPYQRNEAQSHYQLAYQSINFLRAYLALAYGKLPSYRWIATFDFKEGGEIGLTTEALRAPLFADWLIAQNEALYSELRGRLGQQTGHIRERIQRACDFFGMALDQRDEAFRFSSLWIALEILVGKSGAIRKRLSEAYNKDMHFVDEVLRFKEISGLRHSLQHQGSFGVLRSYQERLMQLYFWDLVIHLAGLHCAELALSLVQSGIVEQECSSFE